MTIAALDQDIFNRQEKTSPTKGSLCNFRGRAKKARDLQSTSPNGFTLKLS
jgi:hypothetical protein